MYTGYGAVAPKGSGVRVSSRDLGNAEAPTEPAGETSPLSPSPLSLEGKGNVINLRKCLHFLKTKISHYFYIVLLEYNEKT